MLSESLKNNTKDKEEEQSKIMSGYCLLTSEAPEFVSKRKENSENFQEKVKKFQETKKPNLFPNEIHYIWLGGELPSKYRLMMIQGKKLNHHYNYNLWYCKDILDEKQIKSLESFAKNNNIKLHNVTEYKFENSKYIEDAIRDKEWAKASDLLRAEKYFAGIYLDTDNRILKKLPDAKKVDLGSYGINIGLVSRWVKKDRNGNMEKRTGYTNSLIARGYEDEGQKSVMSIYRGMMKENLDKYEKTFNRTSGFSGSKENVERLLNITGCIVDVLVEAIPDIAYRSNINPKMVYGIKLLPDLCNLAYDGDIIREPFDGNVPEGGKGYINCGSPDNTYDAESNFETNAVKQASHMATRTIQRGWKDYKSRQADKQDKKVLDIIQHL